MATLAFSLGSSLKTTPTACPLHEHRRSSTIRRRPSKVSCSNTNRGGGDDDPSTSLLLDRRDILIALGGVYGATPAPPPAMARPVAPPDLSKCMPATSPGIPPGSDLLKCCPPYTSPAITDYTFPKTPLRVRRPAHLVASDKEYVDKLQSAFAAMKALPADDPWSFVQQAKIHCAYCNDGYDQLDPGPDGSKVPIQVHGSWLFLPWHRYYVHFYERILGKLIGDDTFALPYWNWDNPDGMTFPAALLNDPKLASLYNPNRNQDHVATGAVVDYQYSYKQGDRDGVTPDEIIKENLQQMRSAFKNSIQLAELFMGDPLRAGEPADIDHSTGRLEAIHNAVHFWVGQVDPPHTDMGNFATAARDVTFWTLHCNVDRLWSLYHTLRGNQVDFSDPDWLDATFLFYDEDRKVVRVKVRDTLTTAKFCYTYEDSPIPWLGKAGRKKRAEPAKKGDLIAASEFGKEPRRLVEEEVRAVVARPKRGRSKEEKEEQVEVLFVEGIEPNTTGAARFDVYVSRLVDGKAGKEKGDLVGSYVKLLHTTAMDAAAAPTKKVVRPPALLKLGLTAAIEDLGADGDDKVVVTLKPRCGDVTVGGLSIKLLDTDAIALL